MIIHALNYGWVEQGVQMELARGENHQWQGQQNFSQHTVLLVDDSVDTLFLHRKVLETHGYMVHTVECGKDALKLLSEIKPPDLIVLDMRMGEMGGSEFLIALEKELPAIIADVPIVFMTAMESVPDSKATGLIRKPATVKSFVHDVSRFIEIGLRKSPHQ